MNFLFFIFFSVLSISLSESLPDHEDPLKKDITMSGETYLKMLRLGDIQYNLAELIKHKLSTKVNTEHQPEEIVPQYSPQLHNDVPNVKTAIQTASDQLEGDSKELIESLDLDSLIRQIYQQYKDTPVAHANSKFNVHIYQFDDRDIPSNVQIQAQANYQQEPQQFDQQNYINNQVQYNQQNPSQKIVRNQATPNNKEYSQGYHGQTTYGRSNSMAQPQVNNQPAVQQNNQQYNQQYNQQNNQQNNQQSTQTNNQQHYNQQNQPQQNSGVSSTAPGYTNSNAGHSTPVSSPPAKNAANSGRLNKVSKSYHKFYGTSKQQGTDPSGGAAPPPAAGAVPPPVGGAVIPPTRGGGVLVPSQIGGIAGRAIPGVPVAGPHMLSHQAFRPHGSPLNSHASNNRGWNGFRGKKDRVRGRAIGLRGLANPLSLRGPPTIGHLL